MFEFLEMVKIESSKMAKFGILPGVNIWTVLAPYRSLSWGWMWVGVGEGLGVWWVGGECVCLDVGMCRLDVRCLGTLSERIHRMVC